MDRHRRRILRRWLCTCGRRWLCESWLDARFKQAAVTLPARVEIEHIETWRRLYLHHFPSPAATDRCNEPSCGKPSPCRYGVDAKVSLRAIGAAIPLPTDPGHPDFRPPASDGRRNTDTTAI